MKVIGSNVENGAGVMEGVMVRKREEQYGATDTDTAVSRFPFEIFEFGYDKDRWRGKSKSTWCSASLEREEQERVVQRIVGAWCSLVRSWGEFEISITIHFKDPAERPVEMFHILKLYATDGTAVRVCARSCCLIFSAITDTVPAVSEEAGCVGDV